MGVTQWQAVDDTAHRPASPVLLSTQVRRHARTLLSPQGPSRPASTLAFNTLKAHLSEYGQQFCTRCLVGWVLLQLAFGRLQVAHLWWAAAAAATSEKRQHVGQAGGYYLRYCSTGGCIHMQPVTWRPAAQLASVRGQPVDTMTRMDALRAACVLSQCEPSCQDVCSARRRSLPLLP
jgi:hypothetical protein